MTPSRRRAGARRALRIRTRPQWLRPGPSTHPIALARCLLLLRVLSGAEPLTLAIRTAKISRPTYYWLERKGLQGMLTALTPTAARARPARAASATTPLRRLEAKVRTLEQAKRRAERLLSLTRTVLPRLRRRRRSSPSGPGPSPASAPARTRRRRPSSAGMSPNDARGSS